MTATPRAAIEEFLSCRRLAIIGVSRDSRDFSRMLYKEFKQRGYDIYPVNPLAEHIDEDRCYQSVGDIHPRVDAAIVMTPSASSESVVRDCASAGVPRIWLYRAVGRGSVTPDAVKTCEELGISVVAGECPFMFLAGSGWIHSLHGLCRRVMGTYPA